MTTMQVRDVSLFVDVVGHGSPVGAHARRPGADHWTLLPFRRLRGSVHLGLLRPSLQRTVDRRPRHVDDLGEPDRRCRRAAREAGVRAVGRARSFVRRQGRPRVRAALPGQPVAPRVARHRRRQLAGRRRTRPELLARRGYSPKTVKLARRFLNGQIEPREFLPDLLRLGKAYNPAPDPAAAGARHDPGGVALEDAAGGAHLRGPAPAQGLDGHGSPRRDQGADAGDGGA